MLRIAPDLLSIWLAGGLQSYDQGVVRAQWALGGSQLAAKQGVPPSAHRPRSRPLTPPIRARLLALLNPAIPAIFIEGGVGTHKSALLDAWVQRDLAQLRVAVEFDNRQLTPSVMINRLAYQLELAGADASDSASDDNDWTGLVARLAQAMESMGGPLTLGIHRMDELPPEASVALIEATTALPGLRIVATAVDADFLIQQAVGAGVGNRVVGDGDLAYTPAEVAQLLVEQLGESTESTVRAVLEATRGVPALVERAVALFGPECVAGTINDEQAVSGWIPERHGAGSFRTQIRQLAQVPRFSYELLVGLYGAERAEYLFTRLPKLGVGEASQPLSGLRMFTWRPALRQHILQIWHGDASDEVVWADRAQLAQCAVAIDDPELALAMLVANRSLTEAEALCKRWLWELTDADAQILAEHLSSLDPGLLRDYPTLLVAVTLAHPSRGEVLEDGDLAAVQREMLSASISGDLPAQLSQLAKAATLALAIGEIGRATRASVRWANLALSKPQELAGQIDAEAVSDALLVTRALLQLDRIDLVPELTLAMLGLLRRSPERAGTTSEARVNTLLSARRFAAAFQGTPRAEIRSIAPAPRQYHREFDVAIYASLDACEALDRGDLASAEAFTRVAVYRLPNPSDWPVLVFLRVVALVGLGNIGKLDELVDQVLATPRWEAWQHHPEAPGLFAVLTESMVAAVSQRLQRTTAELNAIVRSLPPGALHRWPGWGRVFFESLPHPGITRGAVVPTDAELDSMNPRVRWQVGLVAALTNLRAGEEATAIAVAMRGGAKLKYPSAPFPLVLASSEEIQILTDRLPSNASAVVRASLELASSYVGIVGGSKETVRFAARELEVLDGVRRGLTNVEIAKELYVSVNTVKFHRANLYRKLNATSREELLAEALQQGL